MFSYRCILTRLALVPLAFGGIILSTAHGDVSSTGNVIPVRNPFDTVNFPGLPTAGNFIIVAQGPDANNQTNFEGLTGPPYPNGQGPGAWDIIVGQTSFGEVLISTNTSLRFEDLIIGESGLLNGVESPGMGIFRISGFGALYNNNPFILPFGLPYASFGSKRDETEGFDLYVGRAGDGIAIGGNGTLDITAGGRAEIQDAVVIGDDPSSTGNVFVSGIDSFLGNGGFESGAITSDDPHSMIVGRQGSGFLTISAGGTVISTAPTGAAADDIRIGAVIGSDPFTNTDADDVAGGFGQALVTGLASDWIINGSLQVGGFSIGSAGIGSPEDVEGDDAVYTNLAGTGILTVELGGFVSVNPAIDANEDDELLLAIGRKGRVLLNGGVINVGASLATMPDESRPDTVRVLNDGVIQGSGRIETGVFRNRYFGEVRVNAGQHLIINSSSEFLAGTSAEPLVNYGVMRVLGSEDQEAVLEFDRAPGSVLDPLRPLLNLRVPRPAGAPVTDFYGGLISAQDAVLHFRSNIENEGMMAFTDGNNYVTGHVFNIDPDPMTAGDDGIIIFSGPDTKVVFENDLLSTGTIIIEEGADVDILARHSFVTAGELRYQLNPSNSSQITTAGDLGITGKLSVTLSGFTFGSLQVGDTFEIITAGGQLGGVDLTDPRHPVPDLTVPGFFTQLQMPNLAFYGLPANAVMFPIYFSSPTGSSVLLSIFSLGAASGPDFNGDGVVDLLDLAIWKANKGITMGATVLQGDANGDGAVDGADYNIWFRNLGPFPGAGGGSGSGASVPEPTGLALLFSGGLLAVAFRRRR